MAQTVIRYTKPNGMYGSIRSEATGKRLAMTLRSIENKGNSLTAVTIPMLGTLTGTEIYKWMINNSR